MNLLKSKYSLDFLADKYYHFCIYEYEEEGKEHENFSTLQ